jgi:hypothetical protein
MEIVRKEKKELESYIKSVRKPSITSTAENINDLLELSNEELDRSSKIISEVVVLNFSLVRELIISNVNISNF